MNSSIPIRLFGTNCLEAGASQTWQCSEFVAKWKYAHPWDIPVEGFIRTNKDYVLCFFLIFLYNDAFLKQRTYVYSNAIHSSTGKDFYLQMSECVIGASTSLCFCL